MICKDERRRGVDALDNTFGQEVLVDMICSGWFDYRIGGVNSSCSYYTNLQVAKCSAGAGGFVRNVKEWSFRNLLEYWVYPVSKAQRFQRFL